MVKQHITAAGGTVSVPDRSEENRTIRSTPRFSRSSDPVNDEILIMLADAYENKRARQIVEWEDLRRRNLLRVL